MVEPRTVCQKITLDVTYDVVTEEELAADPKTWLDKADAGHWMLIKRPSGSDVVLRPYMVALDGPWKPEDTDLAD